MTSNRQQANRQQAPRIVPAVIIALLLLGQYVDGLTPSKPNGGQHSHKRSNLNSSVAANDVKHPNIYQRGKRQQKGVSRASIFVKNINFQAQKNDIVNAFESAYGTVKSVWIPRDFAKKGYAKVEFEDSEDAQRAVKNGRLNVLGRNAFVSSDERPADTQGDAFRFLSAFSKGDFDRDSLAVDEILAKVKSAGNPRSEKERGILAAALARVGARKELIRVLTWKNTRNLKHKNTSGIAGISVYNSALSGMKVATVEDCKLARELVQMTENGSGANARTYATAIASIKRGANNSNNMNQRTDYLAEAALGFFYKALAQGVANHVVYNELIGCLGKLGNYKMATNILDQMFEDENVEPTEVSLNSAIAACASAGELEAASKIYQESFAKAKLTPTIVTTNSLLSTAHKWIKKRRCETYNRCHGELNPSDAAQALEFVRDVLADASQRGDELDIVSTNTLVSAYGTAGDVDSAMKLFGEACSDGTATTVTANAALSALALAGDVERAIELVHSLDATLGIETDTTSWNTAISACGITGDLKTAMQLLKAMPHSPDAHSVASVLSVVGAEVEETSTTTSDFVSNLLEQADSAKATTTFVLNAALAAFDRIGDSSAAQKLFEEGFEQRGLTPDVVSYNTAIHTLGRNDPSLALNIFSGMMKDTCSIQADEKTYCAVIASLADSGMHEEALRLLQSCPPSVAIYNEALRACHGAAEPEAARELLQQMKSQGPEPNLVSTTIVMNTCAKAGREYEAGFDLFEDIESPDLIAFNSAIDLAEKSGDTERAISLLTRLVRQDGISPDAVSFCTAIAACERSSVPRFRAALRILKESIKAVGPNAGCYIATVQTLAAAGKLERALALLEHDCVENFDHQSKYVLYRTVQVGCAAAGDSINADRLGKTMKEQNLKALAPHAIIRGAGHCRNFDNKIDSKIPLSAESDSSMADVANMVDDLVRKMNHQFVTSALPIEFQASASQKGKELSLANHAEKKALAQLLIDEMKNTESRPSFATLVVEINFKMCADCHDFFKGASAYLDRRITVKEPTMLHVFEGGECSCHDSWRWEERHAFEHIEGLTIPGLQQKVPAGAAAKHRFGRLPPLLKP